VPKRVIQTGTGAETTITCAGIDIAWQTDLGTCTANGLPVALMWIDTTLAGLMAGLHAMVGTERFALALQSEGRKSVETDWAVIAAFADFRDGFEAVAGVARVAGWGDWSILLLDQQHQTCRVRVSDSWEGRYQKALNVCWGSAMLAGKLAGYCSRLFGVNCWAEQTHFIARGDDWDEFAVGPSSRTIEDRIEQLLAADGATRADMAVALQKLRVEIARRERIEVSLRESETRFRALFTSSKDAVFLLEDGAYVDCNPAALRTLGVQSSAEVIGKTPVDFSVIGDDGPGVLADRARARMQAALAGEPQLFEWRSRRLDGAEFTFEIHLTRVGIDQGNLLQAVCRDITERKQAEQTLEHSRQFLQSVFDAIQDGISVIDERFRILRVNNWLEDRYPDHRPLVGRACYSAFQGRDTVCPWCPAIKTFTTGETSTAVVPYPCDDNPEGWLELSTYPLRDAKGHVTQVIGYAKDITLQRSYQQKLEHIAHYDPLTDLPNRTLLAARLEQAMAQASRQDCPLALGYLDLDGFKDINDQHGHDVGDALLVVMASRVNQVLRDGDMVARLGGDEFVVILNAFPGGSDGEGLLAGILASVARPIQAGDLVLQLSASLGVTLYPQAGETDADQLLRQADQAMYQAKLQGKNRFHLFDTEADRRQRGRHERLQRVRRALDDEEFVLYFQPKVNMRTGEVVGAEALVRWRHPRRGLLPPAEFLPIVENQPLGLKLEDWIFARALSQMEHWRAHGLTLPVSINVSAYQLQQAGFVAQLGDLLRAHPHLDPALVELEVLETSALEDLNRVSRIMRECVQLGVRFALDDFGTGYSSLTYLKHLPAAVLKVDQSFVRDMLEDADDLAILEGIRGMAHAFRRQLIAEGVETQEHGELLLALGCDLAQGYGIARPMPAAEIPAWIARWTPPDAWLRAPPALGGADLPLLYAGVEHRGWVLAIETYLAGQQEAPPALEVDACRFGAWLRLEAPQHQTASLCLGELEALHDEIHQWGKDLIERQGALSAIEREAGLTTLKARRDGLLAKLKSLMHGLAERPLQPR